MNIREIFRDLNDQNKLNFATLLGVIYYAFAFFYIIYFGVSEALLFLSVYIYFIVFIIVFILNVLLNIRLFTGKLDATMLNFAYIIPSIVMGAGIILTSILIPDRMLQGDYELLTALYLSSILGLGICLIQFIFYGVIIFGTFLGEAKNIQKISSSMLPLGAFSIITLNLLIFPQFNSLNIFYFSGSVAFDLSLLIWGTEILYMCSGVFIFLWMSNNISPLSKWAFVFPLGISIFSTFLLWSYDQLMVFKYAALFQSIILIYIFLQSSMGMLKSIFYKKSEDKPIQEE
jgi:hypothetical protein